MIRAILFDKDGTLVDFEASWRPVYTHAARFLATQWTGGPGMMGGDAPVTARADALAERMLASTGYDAALGRSAADSTLVSGSNADIASAWASAAGRACDAALVETVDRLFTASATPVAAVSDLDGLLAGFVARDIVLGVATMDSETGAFSTLDALGVRRRFAFVCGYDSGFGVKPGAGMVLAFCEATGLAPAQVAVVGDSLHDVHMGRAAGAGLVVGIDGGSGGRADLAEVADHVVADIGALGEFL